MRHGVCGCRDGGVAERHEAEQGRSEDGVRAQVGWGGVSGVARQRGGSERSEPAVSGAARHARAALKCLRAQSREGRVSEGEREEREEREKGSGERNKSQRFDLVQTRNFQLKLEKI